MPRGPRRYLRPVTDNASHFRRETSRSSWPADWHASSRNGIPAASATSPISSAGLTSPPWVGTWLTAISLTLPSIRRFRSSTSSWPDSSSPTTSTTAPVRRAICRYAIALLAYSAVEVRIRSPAANGSA